jgi:hypothetical protein
VGEEDSLQVYHIRMFQFSTKLVKLKINITFKQQSYNYLSKAISRQADMDRPAPSIIFNAYSLVSLLKKEKR